VPKEQITKALERHIAPTTPTPTTPTA